MNFSGTLRINKFAFFILGFIMFLIIYWRSSDAHPVEKSDLINLKHLLTAAIYAAERGGKKVVSGKSVDLNVQSKGKTKEGMNDPVTDADYASHCAIYYSLKNTYPKLSIVSEEHVKDAATCSTQEPIDTDSPPAGNEVIDYLMDELVYINDVKVWIDPLDATLEYTEGLYKYVTTMVCVTVRGVPVIGVVHQPFAPATFWGWDTKRTSNNFPSVPHKEENKEQPTVVVSRSHPGKVAEIAKQTFGPKTNVTPAAGAGYKVMGVVNGTYDLYLHVTAIKKWDLCAGNAIIKAVNGKMTTLKGDLIDYSSADDAVVRDGILVTRFDHDFYLGKIPSNLPSYVQGKF